MLNTFFAPNVRLQTGFFSKNLWRLNPSALNRPYIKSSVLKSTFFPLQLRNLKLKNFTFNNFRKYATHRDVNFKGQGNNQWKGKFRFNWYLYKKPLLFTTGFLMVNSVIWPYVFKIPGLDSIKRRPENVMYAIMGINLAVFLGWRIGNGAMFKYLHRYGILHKDSNYNNWQLVGSAFSHMEIIHLGMNMFVLYQFGVPAAKLLGAEKAAEIYMAGAVVGNITSVLSPVLTGRKMLNGSLGASGAVFTMFGMMTYLLPSMNVQVMFIPVAINGWDAFALANVVNVAGALFRWGGIDWLAHLGGSLVAVLYGKYYQQRREQLRRQRPF